MEIFTLYMVVGLLAGFVGGLFGVGGGVVIVPLLILSFTTQGFAPDVLTHMAIGTSLTVIVVISINSSLAHHQRAAVEWGVFKQLSPGIVLGAILGSLFAAQISGPNLQLAFGVVLIILGVQAGVGFKPKASGSLPQSGATFVVGSGIGGLSAMFGIGGGSLTTPFLLWCSLPIRKAIGTSAACGVPIGVFSAITYSLGVGQATLPEWSLGYIYLPALAGVSICSLLSVRWGAALAHHLPERVMKLLFAILSVVLGLRFITINV